MQKNVFFCFVIYLHLQTIYPLMSAIFSSLFNKIFIHKSIFFIFRKKYLLLLDIFFDIDFNFVYFFFGIFWPFVQIYQLLLILFYFFKFFIFLEILCAWIWKKSQTMTIINSKFIKILFCPLDMSAIWMSFIPFG